MFLLGHPLIATLASKAADVAGSLPFLPVVGCFEFEGGRWLAEAHDGVEFVEKAHDRLVVSTTCHAHELWLLVLVRQVDAVLVEVQRLFFRRRQAEQREF